VVGAIAAAFTTWLAVKSLIGYFKSNRLTPFGIYCLVAGITCTLIFAF
jgi:undecaprenyl pyrophosphate phosphatase UppP